MKVSENDTPVPTGQVPTGPAPTETAPALNWPARRQPIAPWWHTALIAALIVGTSILSSLQSKAAGLHASHIRRYAFTIAWEWILALIAWWGLRMRHTPLREVLGLRRSGINEWARDFGIAFLFWTIVVTTLAALATLLRLAHLLQPQKAVIALAPQTLTEVIAWIALCATAGIVEEFVFRGYLFQQFASIRGKLWIGIVASSLLFGAAHGYEGIGGMIVITAYGAMFCLLAIYRRSLRAGMIAHTWHDSLAGIVLAIAKHAHLL